MTATPSVERRAASGGPAAHTSAATLYTSTLRTRRVPAADRHGHTLARNYTSSRRAPPLWCTFYYYFVLLSI